jgi:hypothetical protein
VVAFTPTTFSDTMRPAGTSPESGWTMCQPYCVFSGCEISRVPSRKVVESNGSTVSPRAIHSRPPTDFPAGSSEYFLANTAKSTPRSSWA